MTADDTEQIQACLPPDLRGPGTTITRASAGLSGAGVYHVDTPRQKVVLKISAASEPIEQWHRKLFIQQHAASAGVAPRLVHIDETRRATVTEFVVDRSFPAYLGNPATRGDAVALLGRTLRRTHELPLPPDTEAKDPREFINDIWNQLRNQFAIPSFAVEAIDGLLAGGPPMAERVVVLSHNDINPSNLVYDGTHLVLVDWDMAGPNDSYFDLGTASLFFRMNGAECRQLLSAYEGRPVTELPPRFAYNRGLSAALCGVMFLHLARMKGHPGATGNETLDSTPTLGEFYQQLRAGAVKLGAADANWAFALALVKAGREMVA